MREMKDSGLKWIGQIPNGWEVNRIKYLFKTAKGLSVTKDNLIEEGLPVISYGQIHSKINTGVIVADELRRFVSYDYRKYVSSKLEKFDFAFADTSEDYEGCGNCVYKRTDDELYGGYHVVILHSIKKEDNRYFAYLFQTDAWREQIRTKASGVKVFSVTQKIINEASVIIPPVEMQARISNFLDAKCAEIDALTADIQTQIDTLEQYKRSVITESVTKGLNPDVEMKDSGTPWCPLIPIHWKYANPKALFTQRLDRAYPGDKQLTASQEYGVIYQDEYMELTGTKIVTVMKDFSILKHVEPNDFVISMRSFQGGLEYSERRGSISSAYVMLIPNNEYVYPPFYRWFFKSSKYINAIQSTSNLVRDGQAMRYANFAQVPLFIIPLDEQKQISEYLDEKVRKIDEILKIKKNQLEILAEYKKSLIYEYVTGKKEVPSI
ncbi:restriction endonuclease subunit S [Clostridium sp. AM25-23AC]|jgi:type I restriction enzyme S subunit|uniref:restriction endonuclease subunit S n=1 Tax=Clostridium sp. AM25-23AC TaxID=2305240 RepID=UPI000E4069A0|nr:restriction endonuclease subunit S [Clostridium sp. AM25-23AC]RGD89399.1 restriction endonuclease subunit S [Clostridium sp. AM25-23AC]RJW84138.1 restriction endonuclease subunit S [Clostridiales bacterium AF36-10]